MINASHGDVHAFRYVPNHTKLEKDSFRYDLYASFGTLCKNVIIELSKTLCSQKSFAIKEMVKNWNFKKNDFQIFFPGSCAFKIDKSKVAKVTFKNTEDRAFI